MTKFKLSEKEQAPDKLKSLILDEVITFSRLSKNIIGYIYVLHNTINDKLYIGKTVNPNYYHRMSQHYTATEKGVTKLYRALRKYNWDNFNIYIIFQSEILENNIENKIYLNNILSEKEIQFINLYDTVKNGYNTTLGGEGTVGLSGELSKRSVPILQYTIDGKFIKEWSSINECANCLNLSSGTIHNALTFKLFSYKNYIWIYKHKYNENLLNLKITLNNLKSNSIKNIYQFDLNGNFINHYTSIREASINTNTSEDNLYSCLNKNSYTANNFIFMKENNLEEVKAIINHLTNSKYTSAGKTILQFNYNKELIGEYDNRNIISNKYNITPNSVSRVLSGERNSLKNTVLIYKHLFTEELLSEKIIKAKTKNGNIKYVMQFDLYGNYINTYNNCTTASKAIGCKNTSINECAKGEAFQSKGYIWIYEDDYTEEVLQIKLLNFKNSRSYKSLINKYGK